MVSKLYQQLKIIKESQSLWSGIGQEFNWQVFDNALQSFFQLEVNLKQALKNKIKNLKILNLYY